MAPSEPSLFFFLLPACSFFLFSLWISGFVFLRSLFIYILSHLSPCLLSVSLVKSKLDPESLGIILLGPFLLEFFPDQVGVCVCVCMSEMDNTSVWQMPSTSHKTSFKIHGQITRAHTHNCMGDTNVYHISAALANQGFLWQKYECGVSWNVCMCVHHHMTLLAEQLRKSSFMRQSMQGRQERERWREVVLKWSGL